MTNVRKKCNRCFKRLSESKFPSNGVGGRRRQCVFCMREINRVWRAANKARVVSYNKARPPRSEN